MVNVLASIQSLWKPRQERIMIFGNDSVGKTTLLYQLKLGQCFATIPTIGFNIESIDYEESSYELWDIGGCAAIKPLWRHYAAQENLYWFLVDISDGERMDEALQDLRHTAELMVDVGAKFLFIVFNKQDMLSCFKIEDQCKHMENLRSRFLEAMIPYEGRLIHTLCDIRGLSAAYGNKVWDLVGLTHRTITQHRQRNKSSNKLAMLAPNLERPPEDTLKAQIEEGYRHDLDADTFWRHFEDADLAIWDHRSHLRAGYQILLHSYKAGRTAFDAVETFIDHLLRLRAARPDHFRNTMHKTMTMFWMVQLEYAIQSYHHRTIGQSEWPTSHHFQAVLLQSPHLMFGGLWKEYYSKDRLFSPEARESWILPDLQGLPQFKLVDSKFRNHTTKNEHDPKRLLRFAFRVVQEYMSGTARRGWLVKEALSSLQRNTTRERVKDGSIPPYSETQAYFWIQMVHAAIATAYSSESKNELPRIQDLSFESFETLSDFKPTEWQKYYTPSIWNGLEARMTFVVPDKKALPNILKSPSQLTLARVVDQQLTANLEQPAQLSMEDLVSKTIVTLKEAEEIGQVDVSNVENHTQLLLALHQLLFKKTSAIPVERATNAMSEISGVRLSGYTVKCFWIQQALQARLTHTSDTVTFAEFIQASPQLADERLHEKYYSSALWNSLEAKGTFVQPDKMKLLAFSSVVSR